MRFVYIYKTIYDFVYSRKSAAEVSPWTTWSRSGSKSLNRRGRRCSPSRRWSTASTWPWATAASRPRALPWPAERVRPTNRRTDRSTSPSHKIGQPRNASLRLSGLSEKWNCSRTKIHGSFFLCLFCITDASFCVFRWQLVNLCVLGSLSIEYFGCVRANVNFEFVCECVWW